MFDLYVVTDRKVVPSGRTLCDVVRGAVTGGATGVQLREKDLATNSLLSLARELRLITKEHDAKLLINDRADIALAVDADGVQLPASSFAVEDARQLLGNEKLIGVSTHSAAEARSAANAGADFILFGPVYDTPEKRRYGKPQGIGTLRSVDATILTPVIAIGGIDESNLHEVRDTGVAGVAVIRAIMAAPNPEEAARQILTTWYATPH